MLNLVFAHFIFDAVGLRGISLGRQNKKVWPLGHVLGLNVARFIVIVIIKVKIAIIRAAAGEELRRTRYLRLHQVQVHCSRPRRRSYALGKSFEVCVLYSVALSTLEKI